MINFLRPLQSPRNFGQCPWYFFDLHLSGWEYFDLRFVVGGGERKKDELGVFPSLRWTALSFFVPFYFQNREWCRIDFLHGGGMNGELHGIQFEKGKNQNTCNFCCRENGSRLLYLNGGFRLSLWTLQCVIFIYFANRPTLGPFSNFSSTVLTIYSRGFEGRW